ncbi:hypothetical protein BKA59DRAFT_493800 [Fusarium tricinctum]|uniref:SnoaL-like domain-containing protein n=1 Tax=Fusarium tricinctum TaxID=61284 RepID=A0A8K0S0G1_9HYPO|nr:hypothetical protein BKA59DRAFT_493800 [Fusarium tricinctum]
MMLVTTFVQLLGVFGIVNSCFVALSPYQIRQIGANSSKTKRGTPIPPTSSNGSPWTAEQNMRQMQSADDAFIGKDLAHFHHHPNATMYLDVVTHNRNYTVLFGEGDWTVALTRATGVNDGPINTLDGKLSPPTFRTVNPTIMTITRWSEGQMMEEYLWQDPLIWYRQLGFLPVRPAKDLPEIGQNPLLGKPAPESPAANKQGVLVSDTALNAGKFDARSLRLSTNATVYGFNDEGLNVDGWLKQLRVLKKAFPDLRINNKPHRQLIAQGEWTATIGMLSGTHKGALQLPVYLASEPVAATGKTFELLHYTICRWRDGHIVEMRVNIDWFGIIGALGISLS